MLFKQSGIEIILLLIVCLTKNMAFVLFLMPFIYLAAVVG